MRFDLLPVWAQTALKNGPVFGSEGDEGTGDAGAGGAQAGAGTDNKPDEKPEGEKPININPDDHAKAIKDRDSAKAELQALQKEKQEREEADEAAQRATRSKEENQAKEIETLTEDNKALNLVNTENLIELSILKNTKYQWINPQNVTKLIDRSEIKIDAKTGKVEGVDDALKALAKSDPHLLKPSEGNGDGNQNGAGNGAPGTGVPNQASGGKPGGAGGDSSAKATKRANLVARFGNVLSS